MKDWITYSLLCLLFNSVWGILSKVATTHINPQQAIVYETIGIVIMAFCVAASARFQLTASGQGIAYCIAIGIIGISSSLLFFMAISKGSVAAVTFLTALYPIFVLVFSVVVLKEQINTQQWLAIVFAFISIVLFTLS